MRWFDPIESKWHDPPTPKPVEVVEADECIYQRAIRMTREIRIWNAVTATAQASQQGDE